MKKRLIPKCSNGDTLIGLSPEEHKQLVDLFGSKGTKSKEYQDFINQMKTKYGNRVESSIKLPEVIVTAEKPRQTQWSQMSTDAKVDLGLTVAGFVPGLDIIADVVDIGREALKGNWENVALGVGMAAIPGLSLAGYKTYLAAKNANKIRKFAKEFEHPIQYTPIIPKVEGRTSLAFYERRPQQVYPKGSFLYPYQNNMGEIDVRSSNISGNNFGKLIGEGSEQSVYYDPFNDQQVLKVYSDVGQYSLKDLRKFVKEYQTRNNVPFQLQTDFVGYVTDKQGRMYPVFTQNKIQNTLNTNIEDWNLNIIPKLNKQMSSVGFNNQHGSYVRGNRRISDIHPQNIVQLSNGEFRFIDAYPDGFKQGGRLIPKHNKGNKVTEIFGVDPSQFTYNSNNKQNSKKNVLGKDVTTKNDYTTLFRDKSRPIPAIPFPRKQRGVKSNIDIYKNT